MKEHQLQVTIADQPEQAKWAKEQVKDLSFDLQVLVARVLVVVAPAQCHQLLHLQAKAVAKQVVEQVVDHQSTAKDYPLNRLANPKLAMSSFSLDLQVQVRHLLAFYTLDYLLAHRVAQHPQAQFWKVPLEEP